MIDWTPEQVAAWLQSPPPQPRLHLVGAGGCGMSALGHLWLDLGNPLSGSDLAFNTEIAELIARGARIDIGHDANHVRQSAPALVVFSSAIPATNPELTAARQLNLPIIRRATLLAALLTRHQALCVAGMHGKTTTSAWLAFALQQLNAAPSYAVGSRTPQLIPHARLYPPNTSLPNPNHWFVAEADESDGTLTQFKPAHAIILNVDEEHLDYFADLHAIRNEFNAFARATTSSIVFCADDPNLVELLASQPNAVSYGFNPAAHYSIQINSPYTKPTGPYSTQPTRFSIRHHGQVLGEFDIRLIGEKNVSNATAVIALLHQLGFKPGPIASAIAPFQGAYRRQQELFRNQQYIVFDDYGHHPNEIRATLQAFKPLAPNRLLVAFQPHRYTRTQRLLHQFANCFSGADRLWLTEIYPASEPPIPGVHGAALADAVRAQGQPAEFIPTLPELQTAVRNAVRPGDLVLFLGAGDITTTAHAFALSLSHRPPVNTDSLARSLASQLSPKTTLLLNEPLAKRTTLRVGGPADFYIEPASEPDLATVLKFCADQQLPWIVIGRGSNLLIHDAGFRGVVLCLAHPAFARITLQNQLLCCGAGARLKQIAARARHFGLSGLEFLEGIPGTVGGALRMNAGAMGSATFNQLDYVRFMDPSGVVHRKPARDIPTFYRNCEFFKTNIALAAAFHGSPAAPQSIAQRMLDFSLKRRRSQPAAPSAGCIFKNPPGIPAGQLIDQLGLKGTRVGGAQVSECHANFIVNTGNASATDILNLIQLIQNKARAQRGIQLETEVEIIGQPAPNP